jgi:hypothetical protein
MKTDTLRLSPLLADRAPSRPRPRGRRGVRGLAAGYRLMAIRSLRQGRTLDAQLQRQMSDALR